MDAILVLTNKDKERKKITQLRDKFREGTIDFETYANNYPSKPKKEHRRVWDGIFESIGTDPVD